MPDPSGWPPELDALVAAPDSHTVVFENDSVRVLRVVIPEGVSEPVHVHRLPSVMFVHTAARIRYCVPDRGTVWESRSGGEPQWLEPEGPHWIENVDDRPYEAYRVELKAG